MLEKYIIIVSITLSMYGAQYCTTKSISWDLSKRASSLHKLPIKTIGTTVSIKYMNVTDTPCFGSAFISWQSLENASEKAWSNLKTENIFLKKIFETNDNVKQKIENWRKI